MDSSDTAVPSHACATSASFLTTCPVAPTRQPSRRHSSSESPTRCSPQKQPFPASYVKSANAYVVLDPAVRPTACSATFMPPPESSSRALSGLDQRGGHRLQELLRAHATVAVYVGRFTGAG